MIRDIDLCEAKKSIQDRYLDFVERQPTSYLKEYYSAVPKRFRRLFMDVAIKASRSDAIKAQCLNCTHFNLNKIRFCEVVECPLHNVRPFLK